MKMNTNWLSKCTLMMLGFALFSVSQAQAQNYWTGAVDTVYTKPTNWTLGRVPSSSDDAIIQNINTTVPLFNINGNQIGTTTVVRQPSLSAALGIGTARTLTISNNARLRLNPQSELDLFGDLINNGSLVGAGALVIKSPMPAPTTGNPSPAPVLTTHSLSGSGNLITINDLMIEQNAPTTLLMPFRLNRQLSLTSNLTTTSAGPLTLLSTPTVTAFVVNNDNMTGTGATAVVIGSVTVQRAIDASVNPGLGYRHYSSPVSNTTAGDFITTGYAPNFEGTEAYNTSPTPPTVRPFPTIYSYNQALVNRNNSSPNFDKGWFASPSSSTPLIPGQGYTVNIAGNQLVDFVGSLNNGPVSVSMSRNASGTLNSGDAGWQFLGNPYPAPLDYSKTTAADRGAPTGSAVSPLDNALYVYTSTSQYGGYYRAYSFITDANGAITSSLGNPVIPVGQAFFVRLTNPGSSGTFTFRNSQRLATSDGTTFQRPAAPAQPQPQLELALQDNSQVVQDMLNVYFDKGSTAGFDPQYDALKMLNNNGMFLSAIAADGQELAIDGRPLPTDQLTIPLALKVTVSGKYTLNTEKLASMGNLHVYLRDLKAGSLTDLAQRPTYSFNLSASNTTPRFELVFSARPLETVAPAAITSQVSLYPNPAKSLAFLELPTSLGGEAIEATLVDALGRTVRTASLPAQGELAHELSLAGLSAGVYALRLHTSAGIVAKRLVIE